MVVCLSAGLNIKNQYSTLKEAENKNQELEIKIEKMGSLKQRIIRQIEYATTSAFRERQVRQLLGMGSENDAWLELSEETKDNFYREVDEVVEPPKYRQWLNLFTQ